MTPFATHAIDAIRRAREQHRAGAGSVLDILLRSSDTTTDGLAPVLAACLS